MSTTTSTRKGGCGCGGQTRTQSNGNGGCGCKSQQPCGCQDNKPREVLGDCSCEGPVRCGIPCIERPSYSAGQLLTADSLRLGQSYFEDRFALRRFVDGVGVVCGLHVRCDPDERGWIIVDPGYAIDCCGNDIVLCEPVRFNACAAIASCPQPEVPCEDVVAVAKEPAPQAPPPPPQAAPVEGDYIMSGAVTGAMRTDTSLWTASGVVYDAVTQQPLPGALVKQQGTNHQTITDASGQFLRLQCSNQNPGPAEFVLVVSLPGYRNTQVQGKVGGGQIVEAKVPLYPLTPAPTTPPPEPEGKFHTYVLRIEGTWEGRAPVPVVTNRAGCDPRPECKPSKQAGSVRLCVSPFDESTTASQVRERTKQFDEVGTALVQRVARALEVAQKLTADPLKDPNPRGRAIADAFLAMLRQEPARSSCNIYDLICDVRRLLTNDAPQCFGFPEAVLKDNELALVGIFGQLLDDMRESYLTLGCDDCCENVGVRIGHVITQDQLPACAPRGCSIAAIDTHAPARETLHPRSAWYYPDQVAVYDAYYRGLSEAAVLLTARGLSVDTAEANTYTGMPTGDTRVREWISAHGGTGELARFALYQISVLYVDYNSRVTLWTVEGRVVAITGDARTSKDFAMTQPPRDRIAYLKYSIAPPVRKELARVVERAEETPIKMINREVAPAVEEFVAGEPTVARQPMMRSQPVTTETNAATSAESMKLVSKLDPAPFKDILWGVGAKTESAFYLRGITTLAQLIATPDLDLAEMIRIGEIDYIKEQAKDILGGKISFSSDELLQWGAAARLRKAKVERSIA